MRGRLVSMYSYPWYFRTPIQALCLIVIILAIVQLVQLGLLPMLLILLGCILLSIILGIFVWFNRKN
jgi:hypothetical protein